MLKFFRDIYTNDDDYIDYLEGKRVAIIDDYITSKSTMTNIFDVCDFQEVRISIELRVKEAYI